MDLNEEFSADDNLYLNLSPNPIRFEPVSSITNVFFDEANQQVFTVRSGGATGVIAKGLSEKLNLSFRMEDKGQVLSIKFSSDLKILAVQRAPQSIEFMNFAAGVDNPVEYSQNCKNKNANVIGFIWISTNEILFITNLGIELFQIYPEKRMLKYIKNYSLAVDWFLHSFDTNILVVATSGSVIQPFQLKPGNIYKLSKLDIDIASLPRNASGQQQGISERDVSIVTLYNRTAVLILRHKPKTTTSSGAEVDVYILNRDGPITKSHVLKLDTSGRFAINVIDNIIIVHHQASKTSQLFDIRLSGQYDGFANYHQPLVVPMPIKQFRLKLLVNSNVAEASEINCELYSANWVVFQPNVIIDAKLGCLWFVQLVLDPIKNLMQDKARLVEFLLQRQNGKKCLMKYLQDELLLPTANLSLVSGVFDKMNENYASFVNVEVQSQMALPTSGKIDRMTTKGVILIDQQDLYTNIFSNFSNIKEITDQFIVFVLTEYIRSLSQFNIEVHHYIYGMVINAMVRQKSFYQLHQFLQCFVVSDSKHLACLLLSLEGVYPASLQLALDMLKRLSSANDLIVEILLSKQKIIPALRFLQSIGRSDQVPARKFLEAAMKTDDKLIFYSVFKFFEERNLRLRGKPSFEPSDMCDKFICHFSTLFSRNSAFSNVYVECS